MVSSTIQAMRVTLFLILSIILCGCSDSQAPKPGEITLALDVAPTNLDPRIGQDATSARLHAIIFSALLKTDEKYDLQPDLAEKWEVPDPLTYIFHLRADATFHDGKPVTSRDVLYTFHSLSDGSIKTTKAGTFRLVQSIEAPDDHTVIFKLKEPFAPFLWNLTRGAICIVPEGAGPDFNKKLIGSGPFKFVRYIQDQEVVLERNDSYYDGPPKIKGVTFKIIPEAIVRALELRKGSVDLALNTLTPDMVEVFKKDPLLDVMIADGTNYQYLAFNMQDPVFSDKRVRQAIAYAIDRDKIIKYLWRDGARTSSGAIPPNNWAYEDNVAKFPYDPAKARALLQEAGHPGLTFTFRSSSSDEARMLATVLQQQLKEAGITMEIRSNEFATFFADVQKGNFQAYSLRWIGANNDPDIYNLIFHSKMFPPNGANRGRYANPEVDRLIDIGRSTSDMAVRQDVYRQIQRIVAEDVPYVSLWYMSNVAVFTKRIRGMKLYPAGDYEFLTRIDTVN